VESGGGAFLILGGSGEEAPVGDAGAQHIVLDEGNEVVGREGEDDSGWYGGPVGD